MTTTDGEALLRAILSDPYEDTVRLAYADWLQELGDMWSYARADIIRWHIATGKRTEFFCGMAAYHNTGIQWQGEMRMVQVQLADKIPGVMFVSRRGFR